MVGKPQYGLAILTYLWVFAGIGALIIVALGPIYFEDKLLNSIYLGIIVVKVIFMFVVLIGLFKGLAWAWTGAVIISIINLVTIAFNVSVLSSINIFNYANIVINALIIIYLMTSDVRVYFGITRENINELN